MKLSLVICTRQRPVAVCTLLRSIADQTYKPDEIIIIDGSEDNATEQALADKNYSLPVKYERVEDQYRGLTRQRNYGLRLLSEDIQVVAFLDDDVILEPDYFEKLFETYKIHPDAIGVGGIDLKENGYFKKKEGVSYDNFKFYELDGWIRKESSRNKARKILGLISDLNPGLIPDFSHGRSVLPPNGKIYEAEHFMGGIASYRREIFDHIKFSTFFDGYSLYEDFDFCVRALKYGKLYVNTNAKVWHYHEPSGRPDFYKYGKMVVRNGWYVWRVIYPSPSLKAKLKWHAITLLLANIRLVNSITGPDRKNAFMDYLGRMIAWAEVCLKPPVIENHS